MTCYIAGAIYKARLTGGASDVPMHGIHGMQVRIARGPNVANVLALEKNGHLKPERGSLIPEIIPSHPSTQALSCLRRARSDPFLLFFSF